MANNPLEVNIHQAKTHLSKLVARVEAGEEIIIARAGKPVARLMPIHSTSKERPFGLFRGDFTVPDDFDDPLPEEVLREFEK